ncbi:hypothetical protein [Leisingera caerulea]|uniref:hypothetical protein n=1 Tax=Leisingera caerulea TaxID=506591 RepID=UPI0021A566EC|nr:hypothetical protein [Leisingera caerulea]UWQ84775.1 hypothetical protein K3726_06120 [Leisingera caerulea]
MSEISKLAELRKILLGMEQALGLEDLSAVERDVYYAASDISDRHDGFRTVGLLKHSLVAGISRPTFFRALKSLVQKGYLSPSDTSDRGKYVVKHPSTKK